MVAADFFEKEAGLGRDFVVAAPEAASRLFFIELADQFRVLAVAHERRRPFYWRRRV